MAEITTMPSSLFPLVYQFLIQNGFAKTAKLFQKEASLEQITPEDSENLVEIYDLYLKNRPRKPADAVAGKRKRDTEGEIKEKSEKKPKTAVPREGNVLASYSEAIAALAREKNISLLKPSPANKAGEKPTASKVAPAPVKDESSTEGTSSDEEEKPQLKKQKAAPTPSKAGEKPTAPKVAPAPVKDESSTEGSSSDEEEKPQLKKPKAAPAPSKAAPKAAEKPAAQKKAAPTKKAAESSSEGESSDEEEPPKQKSAAAPAKAASKATEKPAPPKAPAVPKKAAESSSEDSSSEEDEKPQPPKKKSVPATEPAAQTTPKPAHAAPKPTPTKRAAASKSDDSSEDEAAAKKPAMKAAPKPVNGKAVNGKAATFKKAKEADDDESSDSEDTEGKMATAANGSAGGSKTPPPDLANQKSDSESASKGGKEKAKKLNVPFKRVNPEEQLLDPRLADNSFYSKGGDEWGLKAAKTLGAVKGKNFRHEKTKKKRGTYRGGSIDCFAVNSVKFSDDDQ